MSEKQNKNIDHPSHYNHGKIETIDYIEDCLGIEKFIGFCIGNVLKYISRAGYKGDAYLEDYKKAKWYLNKAVECLEGKQE